MSNFALVFPGQGSQAVGMLNSLMDLEIVRATVRQASEAIDIDIGALIGDGPKEALDLTTNTQPAMLTAGVACYRAWLDAGGREPALVAGHSLGEYSALVASGVINFADAVPLVRYRAQVMQEAVPVGEGGMAAILGLDDDAVRAICLEAAEGQIVEAVNFNSPVQIVIAGNKAAVERACELAKAKGAKRALPLPVSAPFHSSLLKPASEKLRQYLAGVTFSSASIPIINNVDVSIAMDPVSMKDALVRQAAAPVRWVETIQMMASMGIRNVIECGPGKVLAGLTKRIDGELIGESMFDPSSILKVKELLS